MNTVWSIVGFGAAIAAADFLGQRSLKKSMSEKTNKSIFIGMLLYVVIGFLLLNSYKKDIRHFSTVKIVWVSCSALLTIVTGRLLVSQKYKTRSRIALFLILGGLLLTLSCFWKP
jgi:multidrug transporter EmrE-like cation transporter